MVAISIDIDHVSIMIYADIELSPSPEHVDPFETLITSSNDTRRRKISYLVLLTELLLELFVQLLNVI